MKETFGNGGIITTRYGVTNSFATAHDIVVQEDSKVVVAGYAKTEATGDAPERHNFALVRYNPDGSLDAGFGEDGIVTLAISPGNGDDRIGGLAFDANGKLMVTGSAAGTTVLARFGRNDSPAPGNLFYLPVLIK